MKTRLVAYAVIFLLCLTANAQWSELGGTNSSTLTNQIRSICTDNDGNIYAAGFFTNASGNFYVAKWNGNSWSELGGTNSLAANYHIMSICTDPSGNVYAAGRFTNGTSGINGSKYVAKWNGNNWSELAGLNTIFDINCICSDSLGNIYAAGEFANDMGHNYVAKWNGLAWSELGGFDSLGASSNIWALYCDKSNNYIYVGGQFTNNFGKKYIAKWNGLAWSELGGNNSLAANEIIECITGDSAGNIYAGGFFTNGLDMNNSKRYVAIWNGITWSELGGYNSLSANWSISSLCVDPFGSVYAAGEFTNGANVNYGNKYVAKWDGSNWSELGGSNNLAANSWINSVCSDIYGNIYAAGGFYNNQSHQYVAKYSNPNPIQQISLVGTATEAGNFTTNHIMNTTTGDYYTIDFIFLSASGTSPANPGRLRFKSITNQSLFWGGDTFPDGAAYQNGQDITVDVSGYYSVSFNATTGDYHFNLVSTILPTISLFDPSNVDPTVQPIQLTTTDGKTYVKNHIPFGNSEGKFRVFSPYFLDLYLEMGDVQFPTGNATLGGGNIPITAGEYDLVFHRPSGHYQFNNTPADGTCIVTSSTSSINTLNLPQSVTLTFNLQNLGGLNNLTGVIANLQLDEAVFDLNTVTVDYTNSIFGIVDTDYFEINYLSSPSIYSIMLFRNLAIPIIGNGLIFKVTLNTKQTTPNISSTSIVTSISGASLDFGDAYIPNTNTVNIALTNLGNNDFSNDNFILFPNPTKDLLNIDFNNKALFKNGYEIQVYNTLGQVINHTPLRSSTSQISTKKWGSAGIYYIKIIDDSNNCVLTKKIIVK